LPLVLEELSGEPEKTAKAYIPKGFPAFPSIHTYKYTAVDVDEVTVRGSGLKYDDGTPVGRQAHDLPEGPRGDHKKIREAAARESKLGEEALRGVVRASKINALKEVRAIAERNKQGKERFGLWEAAMREFMDDSGMLRGKAAPGSGPARQERVEIADHSMMVNAEKAFHRKEVQRVGKKAAQKAQ